MVTSQGVFWYIQGGMNMFWSIDFTFLGHGILVLAGLCTHCHGWTWGWFSFFFPFSLINLLSWYPSFVWQFLFFKLHMFKYLCISYLALGLQHFGITVVPTSPLLLISNLSHCILITMYLEIVTYIYNYSKAVILYYVMLHMSCAQWLGMSTAATTTMSLAQCL